MFLFIIIFDYFKKYPQKYPQFFLLPPKKHFLAKNNLLQNSFGMVAVVKLMAIVVLVCIVYIYAIFL